MSSKSTRLAHPLRPNRYHGVGQPIGGTADSVRLLKGLHLMSISDAGVHSDRDYENAIHLRLRHDPEMSSFGEYIEPCNPNP